jgi:hypothetical protein
MPRTRRSPAEVLAAQMPERDLQDAVIELFALYGYRRVHFRPGRTLHGWVTPLQGDPGFADNLALRPPRAIFAELKDADGHVDEEQAEWLDQAEACGIECYLWRPAQLEEIPAILQGDERRETHWRETTGLGRIVPSKRTRNVSAPAARGAVEAGRP